MSALDELRAAGIECREAEDAARCDENVDVFPCDQLRRLATDPTYGAPDGPGRDGYMLALEHVETLAGGE